MKLRTQLTSYYLRCNLHALSGVVYVLVALQGGKFGRQW